MWSKKMSKKENALDTVTRFEVIDENGRSYVQYGVHVQLSYQDDNRTLKVFLTPRKDITKKDVTQAMMKGLSKTTK